MKNPFKKDKEKKEKKKVETKEDKKAKKEKKEFDGAIKALRAKNEEVPEPLRLPTEEEVAAAEKELDFPFPGDFREYLLKASDVIAGSLEPAVLTLDDENENLVAVAKKGWEAGAPKELLPFCYNNADYYCISKEGEVRVWDQDDRFRGKWPSFAEWIMKEWLGGGHVGDMKEGQADH